MPKKILFLIVLLLSFSNIQCSGDRSGFFGANGASNANDITNFNFLATKNSSLLTDAIGIIIQTEITITVPFGTNITNLVPQINMIGASLSPGQDAQDFSEPIEYTVTASDGTVKIYSATVVIAKNTVKKITSFDFLKVDNPTLNSDITGTINESVILLKVPNTTDPSALVPSIEFTGATISPQSGTPTDYSNGPVSYMVTAEDGTPSIYIVRVEFVNNNGKSITSFNFNILENTSLDSDVVGVIGRSKITLMLPASADLSNLIPTIEMNGVSITPKSGVANDFSGGPVAYTVSSGNFSVAVYLVNIIQADGNSSEITSFGFSSTLNKGLKDISAEINDFSIAATLPFGVDITSLVPSINFNGASVSPASGEIVDFTNPVTFTVSSTNGSVSVYTVTLSVGPPPDLPLMMGLVMDSSGNLLPGAYINTDNITDGSAIASFSSLSSGWIQVQAEGYATGYVKPQDSIEGVRLFESRLTSFNDTILLNEGKIYRLISGDVSSPSLTAEVNSNKFAVTPAIVSIADINPLDIGPLFQPPTGLSGYYIQRAFSVSASNSNGDDILLADSANIDIFVKDDGLIIDPVLTSFNPASGVYDLVGDCIRFNTTHLKCSIPKLSSLFAIFTTSLPSYLEMAELDTLDEKYKKSFAFNQLKLSNEPNDIELQASFTRFITAVRAYSDINSNEQSIFHLIKAIQAADFMGEVELVNRLLTEASIIADNKAESMLTKKPCGLKEELSNLTSLVRILNANQLFAGQLWDLAKNDNCDLWSGRVKVWFNISKIDPRYNTYSLISGKSIWSEDHYFKIATNPVTDMLRGTSNITLKFPNVKFKDLTLTCEMSRSFYGESEFSTTGIKFAGIYNGTTFTFGRMAQMSGESGTNIIQEQVAEQNNNDVCLALQGYPHQMPLSHHFSILKRGFVNQLPIIDLEDILNSSEIKEISGPVKGTKIIENPYPIPNYGKYPFQEGGITWRFNHINLSE